MSASSHQVAAALCVGRVFHKRLRPFENAFSHAVFFLRVPLSQLDRIGNRWLSRNRFNLLSFVDRDYGPRDGTSLEAWMRALLKREGIRTADGEIVLQTFPRLLGYVFNPVSVWYCHDRAGQLRAALCEVNNTFGERHNYLVVHDDQRPIDANDWLSARKVFHVSPFCAVAGEYRFRFARNEGRIVARVEHHDAEGPLLLTSVSGAYAPATRARQRAAFFGQPLMTLGVIARIHWQALRLWAKRVPLRRKPLAPEAFVTR